MKKPILLSAMLGTTVFLTGCPTFEIGGWIESAGSDGKNNKATFGGYFSCEVVPDPDLPDLFASNVIEGEFQYHDHAFQIDRNGKSRDLSFHGDFIQENFVSGGPDDPLCDVGGLGFVAALGEPNGYCGPARLQPAPKRPQDSGYGQDLAYRIAVMDGGPGGDDYVDVWLGPVGEFGCPVQMDGSDDTDCAPGDLCYSNSGVLGGGQVTMPML